MRAVQKPSPRCCSRSPDIAGSPFPRAAPDGASWTGNAVCTTLKRALNASVNGQVWTSDPRCPAERGDQDGRGPWHRPVHHRESDGPQAARRGGDGECLQPLRLPGGEAPGAREWCEHLSRVVRKTSRRALLLVESPTRSRGALAPGAAAGTRDSGRPKKRIIGL